LVGGDVQAAEAEAELSDDGVVEVLDGGGVIALAGSYVWGSRQDAHE
jgi:hypothetical protein